MLVPYHIDSCPCPRPSTRLTTHIQQGTGTHITNYFADLNPRREWFKSKGEGEAGKMELGSWHVLLILRPPPAQLPGLHPTPNLSQTTHKLLLSSPCLHSCSIWESLAWMGHWPHSPINTTIGQRVFHGVSMTGFFLGNHSHSCSNHYSKRV